MVGIFSQKSKKKKTKSQKCNRTQIFPAMSSVDEEKVRVGLVSSDRGMKEVDNGNLKCLDYQCVFICIHVHQ